MNGSDGLIWCMSTTFVLFHNFLLILALQQHKIKASCESYQQEESLPVLDCPLLAADNV